MEKSGVHRYSPLDRKTAFLCSLPAMALAVICLVPYLGKAYLIDDPLFMLTARQIIRDPLHPLAFEICWGENCGIAAKLASGTILGAYFLVPSVALGGSEWLTHLFQLVALCAAILFTVRLASRFGLDRVGSAGAGLLLVSSPPVMPMANTAMPDVLAMSLGVIGIERLLAWTKSGKLWQGIASGIALGLAACARLHLLLLLAVAAILIRDDGQLLSWQSWLRIPKRRWIPLLIAPLPLILLAAVSREPGSRWGFEPNPMFMSLRNIQPNAHSFVVYWVVAMPFAIPWLALRFKNFRMKALWLAPLAIIAIRSILLRQPWHIFLVLVAYATGAMALAHVLLEGLRKRSRNQIALASWLLIALPILAYTHLPVKYLVASAPAAAILITQSLRQDSRRLTFLLFSALLVICVGYACLMLHADAVFAEMSRTATAQLISPRVERGARVWFSGQWGFYWYGTKAGAVLAEPQRPGPLPGDYLVVGELDGGILSLKRFPRRKLVETKVFAYRGWRTMSPKDGAGLYSNAFGWLPLAWGSGQVDRYEVWQIE
jgi:hypothetical protein